MTTGPTDDPARKEPTPVEDGPFRKMATKVEADPFRDRVTQITGMPRNPASHRGPGKTWLIVALVLALAVILCQSIVLVVVLSTWRPKATLDFAEIDAKPKPSDRDKINDLDKTPYAAPSKDLNHKAPGIEPPSSGEDLADDDESAGEIDPATKVVSLPGAREKEKAVEAESGVEKSGKGPAARTTLAVDTSATLELVIKPEGDVWIDEDRYGRRTSELFSLASGHHFVRVSDEALEISRDYEVRLKSGEHRLLQVDLGRITSGTACEKAAGRYGFVTVGVEGGWAFVYIDGKRVRTTPLLNHRIATGRHRVVLKDGKERAMRLWDICVKEAERTQLLYR